MVSESWEEEYICPIESGTLHSQLEPGPSVSLYIKHDSVLHEASWKKLKAASIGGHRHA